MTDGLDGLPTWLQTTLSSAAALGAAALAVYGWTKKKIEAAQADEHKSADTVLISGALADGPAIRDLTGAIRTFITTLDHQHDIMERVCRTNERIADSNDRINDTMRLVREDVQRIREDRRN